MKWYVLLLVSFLLYILVVSIMSLYYLISIRDLGHIALVLAVLMLWATKSKYTSLGIKIWTTFIALGAFLQLLSSALYLIAGVVEEIDIKRVLFAIFHLTIAIILFTHTRYLNRSIDGESSG